MDLLPDLLKEAEKENKSIYLYGSTKKILRRIVRRASKEYPRLNICGVHSPPFRTLWPEETARIINMINKADPDFLFVSLGCPKQEKWMAEHKGKINACMLGLGQAFNVYAGVEKRLPKWMHNLSLEWTYRLYLEPKRLWKRYLYTNSLFVWLVFKQLVQSILSPAPLSVPKSRHNAEFSNRIER
jgi:N-acetylglucosaminyldiphosphoundecaprenol N-acetyl-beta-D-mannosaminyltransferase